MKITAPCTVQTPSLLFSFARTFFFFFFLFSLSLSSIPFLPVDLHSVHSPLSREYRFIRQASAKRRASCPDKVQQQYPSPGNNSSQSFSIIFLVVSLRDAEHPRRKEKHRKLFALFALKMVPPLVQTRTHEIGVYFAAVKVRVSENVRVRLIIGPNTLRQTQRKRSFVVQHSSRVSL